MSGPSDTYSTALDLGIPFTRRPDLQTPAPPPGAPEVKDVSIAPAQINAGRSLANLQGEDAATLTPPAKQGVTLPIPLLIIGAAALMYFLRHTKRVTPSKIRGKAPAAVIPLPPI